MTEEEMKSKITQAHTDGYNRGLAKAEEKIADLKANFDYVLEGKDLEIKELKDRLSEEVELHLHAEDYIKSLEKENTELRDNYDQFKASAIPEIERLQKENAELKNIKDVADLIRLNNSSIVAMACLNNHNTSLHQELAQARKIILKLYNAGRDVLMCRAEEKAYDNLDNAINDRSIEQFLKEIEK